MTAERDPKIDKAEEAIKKILDESNLVIVPEIIIQGSHVRGNLRFAEKLNPKSDIITPKK